MSIKIKATKRKISVGAKKDEYAFVMSPELYNRLDENKVISEAALRSGMNQGAIRSAWDACGEVIKAWATEGHSVAIPGIGSMRFGIRSRTVEDVADVSSSLIKARRIIFTPSAEIKKELKNTTVNITCYDENGNVIKKVQSEDDGTIEEEEETSKV